MLKSTRSLSLGFIIIGLLAFTVSACTGAPFAGGIAGGIVSFLGVVAFLVSLATSQIGCHRVANDNDSDSDTETDSSVCLSIMPDSTDTEIGVCLGPTPQATDTYVGPCLSPLDTEIGACLGDTPIPSDTYVGPCLDIDDTEDTEFDICLEPPIEPTDTDVGICLSQIAEATDTDVGPCLDTDDTEDTEFDVCLEPPLEPTDTEDPATDTKVIIEGDAGVCLSFPADGGFEPCLTPIMKSVASERIDDIPALEPGALTYTADTKRTTDVERQEIVARLQDKGALTDDVVRRLVVKKPKNPV